MDIAALNKVAPLDSSKFRDPLATASGEPRVGGSIAQAGRWPAAAADSQTPIDRSINTTRCLFTLMDAPGGLK